jgi:hypothetical protein
MYKSSYLGTQIHPDLKNKVKTTYNVEYTEKDEPIKDDYSDVKKINCQDLESTISILFQLRQAEKYNINLYTMVELDNKWIIQDNANDCEVYSDSEQSIKLKKHNKVITESMSEMQKELDMYKSFIKKYNSEKMFKEYQKEKNTFIYYYRLRPPSIGCQPSKDLISMTSEPVKFNNRTYHGTCSYSRELSEKELNEYDLDK